MSEAVEPTIWTLQNLEPKAEASGVGSRSGPAWPGPSWPGPALHSAAQLLTREHAFSQVKN